MDPKTNEEWEHYRQISHQILDMIIDNMKDIRNTPVWLEFSSFFDENNSN